MLRRMSGALLALLAMSLPLSAQAQQYPARPIKAITNLSAGGLSDIFMRAVGEELQKRWGQPVVVENRPGGSYNIGVRACAEFCARRLYCLHPSVRRRRLQPASVQELAVR